MGEGAGFPEGRSRPPGTRTRTRRAPLIGAGPAPWFVDGFLRYNRWLLGRRFAAVRVSGLGHLPLDSDDPVIVYLNHPAWWDPLMCAALIAAAAPRHRHVGLIDRTQLSGVLERLGFIGIEPDSPAGARRLARIGEELRTLPRAMLWLTPQGRFSDPRERPLGLRGGLARLAARLPAARLVPLAIEYPFLGGRRPEARLLLGEPLEAGDADEISIETGLERAMDRLAELVIGGEDDAFRTLIGGPGREAPGAVSPAGGGS